ncbi:unnamed protein product [Mytilus edulis]|uniref:DUF6589 domain-containing protein n=1 Tax=Mytilus edulis TaxID=6550 RepID=A0A8S3UHZ7_MYTED|nr:unnamed protein product [Mytilus edulis]
MMKLSPKPNNWNIQVNIDYPIHVKCTSNLLLTRWNTIKLIVTRQTRWNTIKLIVTRQTRWNTIKLIVTRQTRWNTIKLIVTRQTRWNTIKLIVTRQTRWNTIKLITYIKVKDECRSRYTYQAERECDRDFCLVCGNFAKEARRVETIRKLKGKDYSLKDLLKKYGGINVESGTVCRKCSKKVDSLHKKNTDFYNECQKNAGMSKRMASSPHINPPKRINMSTPKTSTQYAAVFSDSEEEEDDISIIGLHLSDEDTETDQAHVSGILSLQSASSLSGSSSHPFSLDSLTSSATSDSATSFQTASMTSLASSNSVTSNQTGSCSTSTDHIYSKNNEKSSTVKSKGKEDKQRSTIPAAIDHDYIVSKPSPVVQNVMVDKIMDFKNNIDINSKTEMKEADTEILISILKTKNKREVIKHLLTTEGFKDSILCLLMEEINLMSNRLRNRKLFYVSELMKKRPEDLKFFKWNEIICEFMVKFPTVFSLILTMFLTPQDMENKDKIEAIIPRIGMVYSMLMQGRNKELSRIQRITSLFLFDNICDQKVFDRLQTVGVCLSYERSLQIVEMIGGHFNDKVVQLVKDNTRFRIIGDNINWTVGVHDQRINNKQKMMHAFGSAVIVQNLTFTNLDRVVPQQLYSQTPVQNFIPSEEDYNLITTDYIILMSRVVFEHIPYFKKFSDIVPINISTPCSPNLKKKSEVIPLPVLFKNEQYYQDVVGILDFYEKCLKDAHDKAGKQLHNQTYQIGGDQLTRERFSGAKSLRAHHLNPSDKFTHLSPITF